MTDSLRTISDVFKILNFETIEIISSSIFMNYRKMTNNNHYLSHS